VKNRVLQSIKLKPAEESLNKNPLKPNFLANDKPSFLDFNLERDSKLAISVFEDGHFGGIYYKFFFSL
jgi:hypothetical protein